jgi:hypothetical protein
VSWRFLSALRALVVAFLAAPAQLFDPCFGCWCLGFLAECGIDGKLEVELGGAAVAVDLPIEDC